MRYDVTVMIYRPGSHIAERFFIAIHIRWKFRFALTTIPAERSLEKFTHGTRAVL